MPHTASPSPTSSQNRRLKPVPRCEAPNTAATATPLDAICNKFPTRDPAEDVPSVNTATTCNATMTNDNANSFRNIPSCSSTRGYHISLTVKCNVNAYPPKASRDPPYRKSKH